MAVAKIKLSKHNDFRGNLTTGQFPDQLPFRPVRFFVISSVPENENRGQHAHVSNEQILMCLTGGLNAEFHDGKNWESFLLKPNEECLMVPAMHFGKLSNFETGTKLLVLSSETYDPENYINDFEKFLSKF